MRRPTKETNTNMTTTTRSRTVLMIAICSLMSVLVTTFALTLVQAQAQEGADDDVAPAPPSIGADIPLTYFGPAPSDTQAELIGPHQLLRSGQLDLDAGTIELPLYEGSLASGESVWYILTDTTDAANAAALGLNHSPKLAFSAVGNGARMGTLNEDLELVFANGAVDFSPALSVTPGDDAPFPPAAVQPGAIGDEFYSPLVLIENAGSHVYNAPMVAFNVDESALNACGGAIDYSILHDKVMDICADEGTVTMELSAGFSFARPVFYLSTDANVDVAAALEKSTLAPGLNSIPVGADDSAFSAVERIFQTANGPTGDDNPQRQGFDSALLGEGAPLAVLGGIPTIATDYSPLWDVNIGEWTQEAIDNGYRSRVTEEFQILGLVQDGHITGPGGSDYGSSGIIVNCPIVHRFL